MVDPHGRKIFTRFAILIQVYYKLYFDCNLSYIYILILILLLVTLFFASIALIFYYCQDL